MKKCAICPFKYKTKADLAYHISEIHKLTMGGYHMAAKAVGDAIGGLSALNGALKKAGLVALVLITMFTTGCRSLDRLLNGSSGIEPGSPLATGKDITILVAGQSNAVAEAIGPSDYASSATGRVTVILNGHPEVAPSAQSPINTSVTWVHLGDLIALETGHNVRILNVAIGSTNSDQWANNYASRIADFARTYNPDLIIWVQGENDTYQGFTTDRTYANYVSILNQVRAATGAPFYCALDGWMPGMDPTAVRNAQNRMINEGLMRRGADIDQLRKNASNMDGPGIHFQGQGFMNHAQAWFNILKNGI